MIPKPQYNTDPELIIQAYKALADSTQKSSTRQFKLDVIGKGWAGRFGKHRESMADAIKATGFAIQRGALNPSQLKDLLASVEQIKKELESPNQTKISRFIKRTFKNSRAIQKEELKFKIAIERLFEELKERSEPTNKATLQGQTDALTNLKPRKTKEDKRLKNILGRTLLSQSPILESFELSPLDSNKTPHQQNLNIKQKNKTKKN